VELKARKAEIEMALLRAIEGVTHEAATRHYNFLNNAGPYFQVLRKHQLWPLAERLQNESISKILDRIMTMVVSETGFVPCENGLSTDCPCKPACFGASLRTASKTISRGKRGLCLDCVKLEGRSREGKACRFCNVSAEEKVQKSPPKPRRIY
jgi:hypothetical protein